MTSRLRITIGLVLVAFGAGAPCALLYTGAGTGPLLFVDEPYRRLAPSAGNKQVPRVRFPIRNIGGRDLHIQRITTSCGCAVIASPKRLLGAGEESAIEVTATRPPVGVRTVVVTLFTNARKSPVRELHITGFGELEVPFVAESSALVYFVGALKEDSSQQFWVIAVESERDSHWLRSLKCDLPFLGVSAVQLAHERPHEPGFVERTYAASASVLKIPTPGEYRGRIYAPDSEKLTIPVLCQVAESVYASPGGLFASLIPGDAPPRFRFQIIARDTDVVPELRITTTGDVSSVERVQESGHVMFDVATKPFANMAALCGEIQLRSRDDARPIEIRVPLAISRSDFRWSSETNGSSTNTSSSTNTRHRPFAGKMADLE